MNEELKKEKDLYTPEEKQEEVNNLYEASREIDDKYHDRQLAIKVFHAADVLEDKHGLPHEEVERQNIELFRAKKEVETLKYSLNIADQELKGKDLKIEYKDGMIEGLKFALRCNGISGGDVE